MSSARRVKLVVIDDDRWTVQDDVRKLRQAIPRLDVDYISSEPLAFAKIDRWTSEAHVRPDLIILDMRLPGSSIFESTDPVTEAGERIAHAIRSKPSLKDTPIMVRTAFPALGERFNGTSDENLVVVKRGDDIVRMARSLVGIKRTDLGRPKRTEQYIVKVAAKTAAAIGALGAIAGGAYKAWPWVERWLQ